MADMVEQVQGRTELVKAQSIAIGATLGGIAIQSVADAARVGDLLARAGVAVPEHCRDQPGVCFALVLQALEWGFPIMSVVNKSYKPRNGDRIAYEAQLIHAVVEARAPLKKMLRTMLIGTGNEMICRVSGTFIGEDEPHTYDSQQLGKIVADIGFNDRGQIKGSPLWITKPEVQIRYSAVRDWARLSCPGVLLGVYAPDEIEDAPPMDITPKVEALTQKLRDAKVHAVAGRGFDPNRVQREAQAQKGHTIIEGTTEESDAKTTERFDDQIRDSGRDSDDQRGVDPDNKSGDAVSDRPVGQDDGAVTGGPQANAPQGDEPEQGDIFPPDRDKKGKRK